MHRFQQIDVFSPRPLGGNPVAVVHGAEGLTTEQMLEFTRWTNLSEATFLLPPTHPEADYRVRIFTLVGELDFAGHPTLGTCHAWLSAGGRPRREGVVVQECPAGLIRIRQLDDGLAFEAPPLTRQGPVSEDHLARVAGILRIPVTDIVDAAWVDNGPGWVGIMLESADAVVALRPLSDNGSQIDIGIVGLYPPGGTYAYEMRALFTDDSGGMREDPVDRQPQRLGGPVAARERPRESALRGQPGDGDRQDRPAAHQPGRRRRRLGRGRHPHHHRGHGRTRLTRWIGTTSSCSSWRW
jgi:PhzF family phenazine biosynthesis protein